MNKKLYVGNLSYDATKEGLEELFAQFGELEPVVIITDRETQRSKGFGFAEFKDEASAEKALELNGQEFLGRELNVSEARPMKKSF